MNARAREIAALLPGEVLGWLATETDRIFDPRTIFDDLDGAAAVSPSYNFEFLLSRRYDRRGQKNVNCDIFDMGSAGDAYGIFTHDLKGESAGIGQGSTYKAGLLSFWKDRYFISLYAEEETRETRRALLELGRRIASSIPVNGQKPKVCSFVPPGFSDERKIHLFHTHLVLNYHFFVAEQNVLQLDERTEAVLALSGAKGIKPSLLIIYYPSTKKAGEARKSFERAYMPDAVQGYVRTENGKWTGLRLKDRYLIILFDAESDAAAGGVLDLVETLMAGR